MPAVSGAERQRNVALQGAPPPERLRQRGLGRVLNIFATPVSRRIIVDTPLCVGAAVAGSASWLTVMTDPHSCASQIRLMIVNGL